MKNFSDFIDNKNGNIVTIDNIKYMKRKPKEKIL